MADINYYERVIKAQKKTTKLLPKLIMLFIYAVILSIWFVIAMRYSITASMLVLIPLSILTIVLLTWKYTSVDYEYSFTAGIFTFSKIYGSAKRKQIFEGELKNVCSVTPYNESELSSITVDTIVNAIPEGACPNPCICIFEENEKKVCVLLDCDEMSAKIFRFFKPSATDKAVWDRIKKQPEVQNA